MTVALIRPEHATPAWRDVGPMLARAVARTPDKPDVLPRLVEGSAQLWAAIEATRPVAAIVTEITLLPDRWCRIWLVAGRRMATWVEEFLAKLEPWAATQDCVGLWASGREGWARLARQKGWQREGSDAGFPRWTRRF